jgi:hypothetical protein
MSDTSEQLKRDIKGGLEDLATLRDEIRLKVHLAGMEIKDEWRKLEPQLLEVEQAAAKVSEATREALHDAVARLRKLRDRLN